jgi:hypothetical protein
MPSFRKLTLALCATPALVFATYEGCAIYDSSLLGPADASGSDVADAGPPDVDWCNHVHWPARPSADDDASVQDIEFYNALESLDFGVGDAGAKKSFGVDLDNFCTCPGLDSCIPFGDSGTQCDLDGGIDDSLGGLIKEFSGSSNFFDQNYINDGITQGVFGAIFRVRKYNGQANDTKIELSIFISNGMTGAGTDAGPMVPQWTGNDVWTLDPTSLLGGTIGDAGPVPATAYDLNAYVSNYTMVGNISDMPLAIGAATGEGLVTIDLTNGLVVAKLTPTGNTFKVTSGIVAGRWETRKLLTAMQVLRDPFVGDAALCGSDPIYQLLKGRICDLQDIATNVLDDGKGAPCNALSLSFAFTSAPAKYGAVFAPPNGAGGCGPQWNDQCGP